MKKYLLLTCHLILSFSLFAQQKEATYKNGTDSLAFNDGKVVFSITGFAGLSTTQVGEGSYELIDNYLLIRTSDFSGPKSACQIVERAVKDSCMVKVVDPNNYSLPQVLVEAHSNSGKVLDGKITGNDGIVWFTRTDKTARFAVSAMGYDAITVNHTQGKDYLVTLTVNDIIENSTVVFSLRNLDDETISLLLLSDDFNEGKNLTTDLQKLEKKVRKRNLLEKRLKKIYVPYVRR
ncbi:MAG: hypothetical protein LLF80_08275 [Porphyromonadaceae bacterium]|nr:hypothetical protein [Porphyromonadaceae bacterium]